MKAIYEHRLYTVTEVRSNPDPTAPGFQDGVVLDDGTDAAPQWVRFGNVGLVVDPTDDQVEALNWTRSSQGARGNAVQRRAHERGDHWQSFSICAECDRQVLS